MHCTKLRLEMLAKKVTIEEMAAYLGVHRNSVANKLNGSSNFSIDESMKIQEKFFPDKDLKYLFGKGE